MTDELDTGSNPETLSETMFQLKQHMGELRDSLEPDFRPTMLESLRSRIPSEILYVTALGFLTVVLCGGVPFLLGMPMEKVKTLLYAGSGAYLGALIPGLLLMATEP